MRVLCLESGGTKLVVAEADETGRLLGRTVRFREEAQQASQTLDELISAGRELLKGRKVDAVGFGFGGTVSRSDQRPLFCYHEDGWGDVDAHQRLTDAFCAPVFIENDCNVAALAEARVGWKFLEGTLFYVTVGTGIGAGIVRDGTPLRLGEVGEGEIGHLIVEPSGPLCGCGHQGCLETLCSGPGLATLSGQYLDEPITGPVLMERYRAGDKMATLIVQRAADYMAQALAPVVNILAPDLIVFGGGVMQDNPQYLDLVRNRTLEQAFPPIVELAPPRFERSRLRTDVVCQGAALLALLGLNALQSTSDDL